jgi:predicted O-methyltransferase YrrM
MMPAIETGISESEAVELERLARRRTVIEFGAWLGFSSVVLGRVARRLVSVDWHRGDEHAGRRDTIEAYFTHLTEYEVRDSVIAIVGRFEDVAPMLGAGQFEMGFLDGLHDRASVLRDLDLLDRLLGRSATLAVHDYDRWLGDVRFEVSDALGEWLPTHLDWRLDRVVESLAVLRR